jgi:hypothetical protein
MNRGSIWRRGKSSWQIQIYTEGKRYYEVVRGQKRDAQRRLNELLVNQDKGILKPAGRITVTQHFTNWLDGYVKTNCSQRTYEGYQSIIKNHLSPAFGNITLKQLTPQVIQSY